jgi:hypothetical protein
MYNEYDIGHKQKLHARYRKFVRRPLFLLQKSLRYAQLFPAVFEQLKVLEVARQTNVSEDGLLELDAGLDEVAVDVQRGDLT